MEIFRSIGFFLQESRPELAHNYPLIIASVSVQDFAGGGRQARKPIFRPRGCDEMALPSDIAENVRGHQESKKPG